MYADDHKCGTIHYDPKKFFYVISCDGHQAGSIKVVQKNNWLHMAEVQVYGKLKASLYKFIMYTLSNRDVIQIQQKFSLEVK